MLLWPALAPIWCLTARWLLQICWMSRIARVLDEIQWPDVGQDATLRPGGIGIKDPAGGPRSLVSCPAHSGAVQTGIVASQVRASEIALRQRPFV